MNLGRLSYDPGTALEFYESGLTALGALCERTWHDRLEVVAEGAAARLWDPEGGLREVELHFAAADATAARDAAREVFPGCPLTFQMAEALRAGPIPLDRFLLPDEPATRPPEPAILEKLWRAQYPDTARWQLAGPPAQAHHFGLVALVRHEIQAMEQHWSLHRVALSLADGEAEPSLARDIGFQQAGAESPKPVDWPQPDPTGWRGPLLRVLETELADDLKSVRERQEYSLRRELERVDDYFESYERELSARSRRGGSGAAAAKTADRLAAARAEHERRRADQVARHEIRVVPHIDGLLLVAERAFRARLRMERARKAAETEALFIPRSRHWRIISSGLPFNWTG